MHRIALIALLALAALTLPAAALAGAIDLRITYRADASAKPLVLTLHCGVPRGTVAHPAATCRRLIALGDTAFAPTPRGMRACAQIYGGPQTALVTGIYFGQRVWTRLSRVDGCANARWTKVAFVFPPATS